MGRKDIILLVAVICAGAVLQLLFIAVDGRDTPGRAAAAFTKACYALDESTLNQLCRAGNQEGAERLADYLNAVDEEAAELGFNRNYMRMQLTNIHTEMISRDDTTVSVKVSASAKRCIHPVFTMIARFFRIGKTYQIEQIVNLVKEDSTWKVCDSLSVMAGHGAG